MNKDVILLSLVGLFLSYLGYRFKVKKNLSLLSGLDVNKVRDVAGLADWAGVNMFLLAALAFLTAALQFLYPGLSASLHTAFAAVVVVDTFLTVVVGRKYIRNAEEEADAAGMERSEIGNMPPVAQLDEKGQTPVERVLRKDEGKKVRV